MNYTTILLILSLGLTNICFAQKKDKEEIIDTTSNTIIEQLLRQTSVIKKIEFIEVEKVKVVQFQIIIIENLKTKVKAKGLYLSNQGGTSWAGTARGDRHAYLDENEIEELIQFLESCDSKWKNEKPNNQTQYEFESLDNLRINFWTKKNSKSWTYSIKFTNYIYDNTEVLAKSQSDELLEALKQVKSELQKH